MNEQIREIIIENLDMLQVDRLRKWAQNIASFGPDISYWGDYNFVAAELENIASSIEVVIKENK